MENKMREIKIEKITLNIGVGGPGDKLDKAMKLLQKITGNKPIQTKTTKRIPTWGIRPNLPIACKVTIRGKKAEELLIKLLDAVNKNINVRKFDKNGNFSFGINEYINIQGIEYEIDIGIIGLEAAVTLTRPGYRIKRRLIKNKISKKHQITKEEGINFVKSYFNVKTEEGGEE